MREGSVATDTETAGSVHADTEEFDDVEMDALAATDEEESNDDPMDTDELNDGAAPERRRAESSARNEGFRKKLSALKADQLADMKKRYRYLLSQTEIFQHFIDEDLLKKLFPDGLPGAAKPGPGRPPKVPPAGESHRRRKTEKEEDEELLQMEEDDDGGTVITESPSYVKGGKMREYQVQGLNWLISLFENGINGILADEMGLGKTLQTISFLGYLKCFQGISGPHLVVVPKSTLHNWQSEFSKWVPEIKSFIFHGDKGRRAELAETILLQQKFDVCITSYEVCLIEKAHLRKFSWQYIVIDEAHRIKNENSLLSQIVRIFQCRNRLLITGTPLQNNLHELWALLNFLLPDIFSSSTKFDEWFQQQKGGADQDAVVRQLQKVLQPFLLRRIKADVEKSLLPKKRMNLYVGLSGTQKRLYQKILEKDIDAVNGAVGDRTAKTRLLNIVMQLRKCCNHPYLFDGVEPGPPFTTDQHLVDTAGKMVVLDKLLTRLKANGSRVLLFSQMSRVLDILEDYCLWKQYDYCRIDGNTAHEDRIRSIDDYNAPNSSKFVFLLTTRAGGLGINLATADIVIMYDNDWNPQVDLQAEDRAHRIGQTKQVIVFRFITENSVEEKIIERATQKLRLDQLVIQQGKAAQQTKAAGKDELLSMIQFGAQQIIASGESTIQDDTIERILERGELKTQELESKYQNAGLDDLQKWTVDGYQAWEGQDFSGKGKRPLAFQWIAPSKRERRADNYNLDQFYRDSMRASGRPPVNKAAKPPQMKNLAFDFQFYPPRFMDLQRKQILWFQKQSGTRTPKIDDNDPEYEKKEQERLEEQTRIDEAEPLTEEELAEKDELSSQGFKDWSKKDFNTFIAAIAKHGRQNVDLIIQDCAQAIQKPEEEIREYWKVFWKRKDELTESAKAIEQISKGEKDIEYREKIGKLLKEKVSRYKHPLQELEIMYSANKGRTFTEEEDRYLVVAMAEHGIATDESYDYIRASIREQTMFRFDWFIKSRTTTEIKNRCKALVRLLEKEIGIEDEEERPRPGPKKRKLRS
ncbi:hypothetical protein M427DRAFT_120389 [Gonapodya prolifera JEL478]|uniref:Uncharacterized protein n=1 Tax=Gonapodya prolifera (strain JEL478) TaxID=1344416 RepID=A0A139ARL3_GONPJ|nr:hypothetical protein M427DRAFT_120389 [Gonapodya prolifera JEL478]|eukprot:KXS19390.1 hypothetical protein M427DRAFT_120389 [Gonapodya prolifera JEL478]